MKTLKERAVFAPKFDFQKLINSESKSKKYVSKSKIGFSEPRKLIYKSEKVKLARNGLPLKLVMEAIGNKGRVREDNFCKHSNMPSTALKKSIENMRRRWQRKFNISKSTPIVIQDGGLIIFKKEFFEFGAEQ